ncbi:two-component system, LytTR family, sensor histidine kinase AgrC [Enterococcus sp. AZ135]|uniref:sensor histidine kinase n=1 Tax=unclassified Enterococcus TaxID=2608891 RepID=UPI003F21B402
MTNTYSIALYALNYMIILWALLNHRFILQKGTNFLTLFLLLAFAVSFFSKNLYAVIYIYVLYVIEYLIMRHYLSSWLLPSVLIILQDMLVTFVRLVTFYLPVYFSKNAIFTNMYDLFLIACIQAILIAVISFILKKLDKKYAVAPMLKELKENYPLQGFFLLILFFLLLTSHLYLYVKRYHFTLFVLIVLIILLTFTLLSLITLVNKNYQKESFLKDLNLSVEEERHNYELAREYRHDFNSALLGLSEYLANEDIKGAKEYLAELTETTADYLKDYHHSQLVSIQSAALRGLIARFIEKCRENGIYFELIVEDQGHPIPINQIDLLRIVSILTNNAFEASLDERNPYIHIMVTNNQELWAFKIENAVTKSVDITKILNKNYSTKDGHTGLGLSNLNKVLKKYSNANFQLQVKSEKFIVSIEIAKKSYF